MAYDIVFEDDKTVMIADGDITFEISKFENALIRLANEGAAPEDVIIPHNFPSGQCIDLLMGTCDSVGIEGFFKKITISDGIKVGESAFYGVYVKEVVWNDYPRIPERCFEACEFERIHNIQNVVVIEDYAFEDSYIKEIIWPDKCKVIPRYCFFGSDLKSIDNLDIVERVGRKAFALSSVNHLDFSRTSSLYLERSSLADLPKSCKIMPSYYIDQNLFEMAMQ